jgi:hypothetical protein
LSPGWLTRDDWVRLTLDERLGATTIGQKLRRASVLPLLWVLLVVPTLLLAGPAPAAVARDTETAARAVKSTSHRAPPPAFWFAAAAVVAVIVAGAIALGPQGDPQPPRQGSVLKALERRSDPHPPPEDNP